MARKKLKIPGKRYKVKRIVVHRKAWTDRWGHRHPATTYVRKAQVITRKTYEKEDIGAPGRGKKLIPIRGEMKINGKEYHVNQSARTRHAILRALVRKYGVSKVWRRLHAMVIMRKRIQPSARRIFERDRDWVAEAFGTKSLTPRAAIRKWKGMSHTARQKAMPGGKI